MMVIIKQIMRKLMLLSNFGIIVFENYLAAFIIIIILKFFVCLTWSVTLVKYLEVKVFCGGSKYSK